MSIFNFSSILNKMMPSQMFVMKLNRFSGKGVYHKTGRGIFGSRSYPT